MGTRADFYVGRGEQSEWIGSIAWDGYPEGISETLSAANSPEQFRTLVADFLKTRTDATLPEQGWPWPWGDSQTTDYAYAFDDGRIWASCFGHDWFDPSKPQPEMDNASKVAVFPNMKERMKATLGKRSGLLVLGSVIDTSRRAE